jgi:hypothetical protein
MRHAVVGMPGFCFESPCLLQWGPGSRIYGRGARLSLLPPHRDKIITPAPHAKVKPGESWRLCAQASGHRTAARPARKRLGTAPPKFLGDSQSGRQVPHRRILLDLTRTQWIYLTWQAALMILDFRPYFQPSSSRRELPTRAPPRGLPWTDTPTLPPRASCPPGRRPHTSKDRLPSRP